mgnify:CR=1 FL=1
MFQAITVSDSDSEDNETDSDPEIQWALRESREEYGRKHPQKRRKYGSPPKQERDSRSRVTVVTSKGKEIAHPGRPSRATPNHRSQTMADDYSDAPASRSHVHPLPSREYEGGSSPSSSLSLSDKPLPLHRSDTPIDLTDDNTESQASISQSDKASASINAVNSTPFQQNSILDRTLGGLGRRLQQPTSDTVEGEL